MFPCCCRWASIELAFGAVAVGRGVGAAWAFGVLVRTLPV